MQKSARDWARIVVFCSIYAIGFGSLQLVTGVEAPQMLAGFAISTAIIAFIAIKTNLLSR